MEHPCRWLMYRNNMPFAGVVIFKKIQAAGAIRRETGRIHWKNQLFLVHHLGDRPEFNMRRLFSPILLFEVEIHFYDCQRFGQISTRKRGSSFHLERLATALEFVGRYHSSLQQDHCQMNFEIS